MDIKIGKETPTKDPTFMRHLKGIDDRLDLWWSWQRQRWMIIIRVPRMRHECEIEPGKRLYSVKNTKQALIDVMTDDWEFRQPGLQDLAELEARDSHRIGGMGRYRQLAKYYRKEAERRKLLDTKQEMQEELDDYLPYADGKRSYMMG